MRKSTTGMMFHFAKDHATAILAIIASAGVIVTGVEVAKATIKAVDTVRDIQSDRDKWAEDTGICQPELTKEEIVKACWKFYIPAMTIGGATMACIIGSTIVSAKQQKTLTAAYALAQKGYTEYRKQVAEKYGKEEELAIHNRTIEIANDGDDEEKKYNFYDPISERYFESSMVNVQRAIYTVNRLIQIRDWASMNDFYETLGIACTEEGDEIGWNLDVIMEWLGYSWLDFSVEPTNMGDGQVCYVVEAAYPPFLNFV